jgi:hypothetical protein
VTPADESLQAQVIRLREDVATLKAQLASAKEALTLAHEVSPSWLYASAIVGWVLAIAAIMALFFTRH